MSVPIFPLYAFVTIIFCVAYDEQLAHKILEAARERFPEAVGNWEELQGLMNEHFKPWEEWRLALEALESDGLITYDHPIRGGIDKHLHAFVGLKVTPRGRKSA